jgi:Ner family transcriptional regulator
MHKLDTAKKPAQRDWHSYYIVFRLRERGMTLRRLSRLNGCSPNSAAMAIRIAWPKMERLIAKAIGVTPQEIWPSRYHADGSPKGPRRRARFLKHSTAAARRNAQTAAAS